MLREIHEYQIKVNDFVMVMCCYSKLGDDVLLISWQLPPPDEDGSAVFLTTITCHPGKRRSDLSANTEEVRFRSSSRSKR